MVPSSPKYCLDPTQLTKNILTMFPECSENAVALQQHGSNIVGQFVFVGWIYKKSKACPQRPQLFLTFKGSFQGVLQRLKPVVSPLLCELKKRTTVYTYTNAAASSKGCPLSLDQSEQESPTCSST